MSRSRGQTFRRKQARRREWLERQATATRGVSQVEPLASVETEQERAERLAQRTRRPLTIVHTREQEEEPIAVKLIQEVEFKPFLETTKCFAGCLKCNRWRVADREMFARGIPVCRICKSRLIQCPP